ncbi:hypothetical protein [Deinococcus peraridilitoris]|nr:hypothetical protein [Deinococcus peraridilitoris]
MTWNAELYRERHAFVWQAGILNWLDPQRTRWRSTWDAARGN